MANLQIIKAKARIRRKLRSRKGLVGTAQRPRLVVIKSLKQTYVQLVDDQSSVCVTGASTLSKQLIELKASKTEKAGSLGELIASKAKEKGVEEVVFDRSGYQYHGRVKALAEGARKGGLKF